MRKGVKNIKQIGVLCFTYMQMQNEKQENVRVISFDVGIKNMAYCLFDLDANQVSILAWQVLNLLDDGRVREPKQGCSIKIQTKSKTKSEPKSICGCASKYVMGSTYYCAKHAKMSGHILPNKGTTEAGLKKKKVDELQKIATSHILTFRDGSLKKDMVEQLVAFYEKNALTPIENVKAKGAGDVDLICIGRNMKRMLDTIPDIERITHVIIENQISPIANRMKTLQGMLTQYFIMRGKDDIRIEFISSANKLKGFNIVPEGTKGTKGTVAMQDGPTQKCLYKKHKSDGINVCERFLEGNPEWSSWKTHFDKFPTKKDDLADSFLQGIWYLKNRNYIIYSADDLKINSVLLT